MVLVLMGVTGSGKTTVGRVLAGRLGWEFRDADDFHSAANVAKMRGGTPLTDEDRRPWLEAIRAHIDARLRAGLHSIIACSALKEAYRRILLAGDAGVKLIYLKGEAAIIGARLAARKGHYMNPVLLQSQIDTLEEPRRDVLTVEIGETPEKIANTILQALDLAKSQTL